MTFKEALEIAIKNDEVVRRHANRVRIAVGLGGSTGCLPFMVNGEAFYYGFDGVDLHAGKYTKAQTHYLVKKDAIRIIR